jgi:threonine dehydratase
MAEPAAADIRRAAERVRGTVRTTPVLSSRTLSERAGGTVAVKAENLQRTGSFKLRGALAKLDALGEEGCRGGVVCASAGNHGQAVAYAARARGVPCEVFVPRDAPVAKEEAAAGLGAEVRRGGDSLAECVAAAKCRAVAGAAFVHPYDDPEVVAGQGTLGLELLAQVPDLARVVVPAGGGGLAAGIAIAVRSERPEVEVVTVRAAAARAGGPTIADGIATTGPGALTGPLLARWTVEGAEVGEDAIAEAMVFLLERAKLVVEGGGAVGVAALLGGEVEAAPEGTTVVVLSGGNVDAGLLAAIVRRHETVAGRRLVLLTRIADRPGGLARLLGEVARTGANLVHAEHVREGMPLHVRETAVQLTLETRGPRHAHDVREALRAEGYELETLG